MRSTKVIKISWGELNTPNNAVEKFLNSEETGNVIDVKIKTHNDMNYDDRVFYFFIYEKVITSSESPVSNLESTIESANEKPELL